MFIKAIIFPDVYFMLCMLLPIQDKKFCLMPNKEWIL